MGEDFSEAIKAKIAADFVSQLPDDVKNQVMMDGVKAALQSWEIDLAIKKAVGDVAKMEMAQYLQRPDVRERIKVESIVAVSKVMETLPMALADVLLRACTGESHYGDRPDTDFTRALARCIGYKKGGKDG